VIRERNRIGIHFTPEILDNRVMRSRLRSWSRLGLGLTAAVILACGCSTHFIVTRATPSVDDSAGQALPQFPAPPASPGLPRPTTMAEVPQFITAVFNDAQADWQRVFAAAGVAYTPAKLTLFSSNVTTGCGVESAATGPFYCPTDLTVYLDVAFFDGMQKRYGLTGDFAQAYVVAHELGHHVQRITGLTGQVQQLQTRDPGQANALSVLTELQADCYAGVWAHSTYQRGLLEPGDINDALNAAGVVGDDFLQQSTSGTITPEKWTHGSSAQRQKWLTTGYNTGQPSACDTFTRSS
jgi:uncharacterized protein